MGPKPVFGEDYIRFSLADEQTECNLHCHVLSSFALIMIIVDEMIGTCTNSNATVGKAIPKHFLF